MRRCVLTAPAQLDEAAWLSSFVPQILNTRDFATSVLFLLWDEGTTAIGGGGLVPMIVFNLLRTIEDAWSLPHLGQAANAAPMTEYFTVP